MAVFFGIIMAVGLLYLLSVIFGGLGEVLDFNIDGTLESMGIGGLFGIESAVDALDGLDGMDGIDGMDSANASDASSDAQGIGCLTISAFMSMFGAIGMVGTLSGRSLWLIVLVGVILSYAMARVVAEVMKYVYRQQGNSDYSISELVGKTATATINSESGKTGEVMIEAGRLIKYPVREINGEPLKRGDSVIVREIDGRYLKVEKVEAQ
ncbi:MAG: hypothetical protein AAFV33_02415 [Chloroflexota bacterium]